MTSDSIRTRPRMSEPRISPTAPGLRAIASAADADGAALCERAEPGREGEREARRDDRPFGDLSSAGGSLGSLRVKRRGCAGDQHESECQSGTSVHDPSLLHKPGGFAPPDPPSPSLAGAPAPRAAPAGAPTGALGSHSPGGRRRTPHRRRSGGPCAPRRSGGRAYRRARLPRGLRPADPIAQQPNPRGFAPDGHGYRNHVRPPPARGPRAAHRVRARPARAPRRQRPGGR